MDRGKIALLLFLPLFVLGFLANEFHIKIGAARYIKLAMLGIARCRYDLRDQVMAFIAAQKLAG